MSGIVHNVLLVEDELLIALDTQAMLTAAGFTIAGPAADVASGLALLETEKIDAAVLDVNLRGAEVWPLALELQQRGVPFVLLTGYGGDISMPATLRSTPRLGKPVAEQELIRVLSESLARKYGA